MKLARRLSRAYLRLLRRSRTARRVSIAVLFLVVVAMGPPWLLALTGLAIVLWLVGILAVRDGLFDPVVSRKVDDDWF
jgi:integral membrane sensor domain MASE1